MLAHLEPVLASDDTAAGDLFEANRPLLLASLGAGVKPFEGQIMNFDYPAALATLQNLMRRGAKYCGAWRSECPPRAAGGVAYRGAE